MAALDTNVLVRYLVEDDKAQFNRARRLVQGSFSSGNPLFVPVTVLLELEWVLRTAFAYSKSDVLETLDSLLSTAELSFESELALEYACLLYGRGSADFSDCLHVALAAQADEQPLWTFDRAASKLDGASLL